MRDAMLRTTLILAVAFGWPAGMVSAQDAEAADTDVEGDARDDGGDGDDGDDGDDADDAAGGDDPAAGAESSGDEEEAPAADTAEADDTVEGEGDGEGEGDEGDLSGAITTSAALTDEQILSPDESMLAEPLPDRPRTGIYGRVIDAGRGEPLYDQVPVFYGANDKVFTTADGFFAISVGPGSYDLGVTFPGFKNANVPGVRVRRGQVTEVVVRLEADLDTDEGPVIEIRGERGTVARRIQQRREAASASDGFTAEEIKQSGDSDVGSAARRVVGATVDREGYLYVRGLGGRYVNTMVNDSPFPSTNPDNPSVRLTLFPTNILSGISIFKTYNAEYPAAATAGTLLIETKTFPTQFEVQTSLSLGLNTETTFGSVPAYEGGNLDWLGVDDGTREIPGSIRNRQLPNVNSDREGNLDAIRQFGLDQELQSRTAIPNIGVGLSLGDTLRPGGRFFGYYLAFSFKYDEQQLTGNRIASAQTDPGSAEVCQNLETRSQCPNIPRDEFVRNENTQTTEWGALGTATYELLPGQSLNYTTLFTRRSEDYAAFQTGTLVQDNQRIEGTRFRWTEEQVWWHQLHGEHEDLPADMTVDWRVNASLADRAEPDTQDVFYRANLGGPDPVPRFQGLDPDEGRRIFSELDQVEIGGALDVTLPISNADLKTGVFATGFNRDFQLRRFEYDARNLSEPELALPPDELFQIENFENGVLSLGERTRNVDAYSATQRNYAVYGQVDTPVFVDELRLIAGVRGEIFRQQIETNPQFSSNPDQPPLFNDRTDVDVLPAVNAVIEVYRNMQVRAAYSITLARPQIRELAPYTFPDFERGGTTQGNPDLERTRVQNFDLRWEWFPGRTEVLAVTGFVKLFENPIERVVVGANNQFGYQNIQEAENFGLEFEARIDLETFSEFFKDQGLVIGTNLTLVRSRIRLSDAQRDQATNQERPVQGQSPFVVNVSLAWTPEELPISLALFYNVFGETVTEVGRAGLQDIFAQPFHSLNFTATWTIREAERGEDGVGSPGSALKLVMKNLLLDEQDFLQDQVLVFREAPGMDITLSYALTFN